MKQDTGVAERYARALFMITERRAETPRALEDLKGLWEVLKPGTASGRMLGSPMVLLSDKRAVLQRVLADRALRSVTVFADLLLKKKRLDQLATIVVEFEALVEKKQGIHRAHVVSAVPLNAAEERRMHDEISSYFVRRQRPGAKELVQVHLTTEVDPRLLGGALVRIGDLVIDRSVRTLLEAMEQRLLETSV